MGIQIKIIALALSVIVINIELFSQEIDKNYNLYEQSTLNYINQKFNNENVSWKKITDDIDLFYLNIPNQYKKENNHKYYIILEYFQNSAGNSENSKIIYQKIQNLINDFKQNNLTKEIAQDCLFKYYDYYLYNKSEGNIPWSFHVFGTSIEFFKLNKNVHPVMHIGSIKTEMKGDDFNKELYQKTIILMICYLYSPK